MPRLVKTFVVKSGLLISSNRASAPRTRSCPKLALIDVWFVVICGGSAKGCEPIQAACPLTACRANLLGSKN